MRYKIDDVLVDKKDGSEWVVIGQDASFLSIRKKGEFPRVVVSIGHNEALEQFDLMREGAWLVIGEDGFIEGVRFVGSQDKAHGHYYKDISKFDELDVYLLCKIYNIQDETGCIHHALKKLLVLGGRGHKDRKTDLQNAIDTLVRLQQIDAMFDEVDAKTERHNQVVRDWEKETATD